MVPIAAHLTIVTGRIVQTLQTLTRSQVTIARPSHVHISTALAFLAHTTRLIRIAEIIFRTHRTSRSRVAFTTIAHHVVGARVQLTLIGMRVPRSNCVRTPARSTTDFAAQQRISIETFDALITIVAGRKLLARQTFARVRVTILRVTIAFALLAIGEIPKAGLTLITLTTVRVGIALTLTRDQVTVVVLRPNTVTIACLTTFRTETVRARSTFVTLPADNVRFTLAQATVLVAFLAHRSGGIAVAS